MRRALTLVVGLSIVALPAASQASSLAAVPDPERTATEVAGWHWWFGQSEAQLNALARKHGERIVDIEVQSTGPHRFAAALVSNTGVYRRAWGWWYGFSESEVSAKLKAENARIVDLEPYNVDGKRRFAFVVVRNEGVAAKGWHWNYDLTVAGVTAEINKYGIRLVDLDSYVVGGQRRYAYVGIKNSGVDAKAWWWYVNVTPQFVAAKLKEHGARVIDVEQGASGTITVVLEKSGNTYWWWGLGLDAARLEEVYSTHGVRIVDLEPTSSGTFAFVGVDNADTESRRLRALLDRVYDNESAFGNKVVRGVYVKQVGGPVLAQIAAQLRFQPLSTLKLLPYLYVHHLIDTNKASLDRTSVSWVEATRDERKTPVDERKYASCLTPGSANTKSNSARLRDALPTLMWESHNRTLDAILEKWGPTNITSYAQKTAGLQATEMHFGCGADVPWSKNRSTLANLGALFEGVDKGALLKGATVRQSFFDRMINLTYSGASYTSPITGKTTGPLSSTFLRDLVKREAGPGKQRIVETFLKEVVIRGKGGSGGPSSDEFGYSDFLYVSLPFRSGGNTVSRTFVVGWFAYKLKIPAGCPDTKASDGGACQKIWKPERDDLAKLTKEMYAAPIRLALATW